MAVRLNLGCGRAIIEGWVNIDRESYPGVDYNTNLDGEGSLGKFETASVDEVLAQSVFEHLPHWEILLLEIARVLKFQGVVDIHVPYRTSRGAFSPYHVRIFDFITFAPFRSDWKPRQLDFIRRDPVIPSLEFRAAYFELVDQWKVHTFPFSWHLAKHLGQWVYKLPIPPIYSMHVILRRNSTPWDGSDVSYSPAVL